MTVYFNAKRGRWMYDFHRGGTRYAGYCFDDRDQPAPSYEIAVRYQESLRRQIPRRETKAMNGRSPDKSVVYFFATADRRRVKIGHARNPRARLKSVQIGNYQRLTLIGTMIGSRAVERALHEKFKGII